MENEATNTVFLTQAPATVTDTRTVYSVSQVTVAESTQSQTMQQNLDQANSYIMVGGQNGSWFTDLQFPRLLQISLATHYVRKLVPVEGQGTIWSGGSNGSDWLISGWGISNGTEPLNPYLFLFNGTAPVSYNVEGVAAQAEWNGGDIFSISSNGSTWFLSGMGSGELSSYSYEISNHLSAGIFNGTAFTDLSALLPQQMDGILYANAFGDNEWLIGGGYQGAGVLFSFNGTSFTDLTSQISAEIPEFHSIQSIAWNGQYWLIGGTGFLAMYNNSVFTDLTPALSAVLPAQVNDSSYSVNSVVWNGTSWLIGGGEAVAIDTFYSEPFLASYNSSTFENLTSALPSNMTEGASNTSVLSLAWNPQYGWIIGGYSYGAGMLLIYNEGSTTNLSGLVAGMNYVIWVGSS